MFCLPVALNEPQYLAERAENVVKRKVIKVNVTPEAVKLMHSGRDLLCMRFLTETAAGNRGLPVVSIQSRFDTSSFGTN